MKRGTEEDASQASNVLIVSARKALRDRVAAIVRRESDLRLIGQVATCEGAIGVLLQSEQLVVLLDADATESASEFLKTVDEQCPLGVQVLLLRSSNYQARPPVFKASCIAGTLLHAHAKSTLVDAVRSILRGEEWLGSEAPVRIQLTQGLNEGSTPALTDKEVTLLQHLISGRSDIEIASAMYVSLGTLKAWLRGLFQKVGVHTRMQLFSAVEESDALAWLQEITSRRLR